MKINWKTHPKLTWNAIKSKEVSLLGQEGLKLYQGCFYFRKPKSGEKGDQYFDMKAIESSQKAAVDEYIPKEPETIDQFPLYDSYVTDESGNSGEHIGEITDYNDLIHNGASKTKIKAARRAILKALEDKEYSEESLKEI